MASPSLHFKFLISEDEKQNPNIRCKLEVKIPGLPARDIDLGDNVQMNAFSEWIKLFGDDVDVQYETEIESSNESEIESESYESSDLMTDVQLCELFDMIDDISFNSRIEKAEKKFNLRLTV